MLRAAVGVSARSDVGDAAREACRGALAGLPGAAAGALVFATPEQAESARRLLETCAEELGTRVLAGASVDGLLASGLDAEGGPAVGVVALAGVPLSPFLLDHLHGDESLVGPEIAARASGLVVVLPDLDALAPAALVGGLPATAVGLGAAAGAAGPPLQWAGTSVATGAVAGMAIHGARPPRVGTTGSCRPATGPLVVTAARGHWVLELDGRPALDVYGEVARGPLARDLRRAADFLLVELARGVIRRISGFDPARGAFALPDALAPGDTLTLALREPEGARADLKRMLAELADPRPALALYFDCRERAASLFGVSGLETAYLESALAPACFLGVLGGMEIGPVAGRPEALTHAGVLALLDG